MLKFVALTAAKVCEMGLALRSAPRRFVNAKRF
jgi:hypothetical protein